MIIEFDTISESELLAILSSSRHDFSPSLDKAIDLNMYAHKWSSLAHSFSVRENDEIVGLMVFYLNRDFLYITHLWVSKSLRNRGLAQTLLNRLIDEYGTAKECILLEVNKQNDIARAFYTKNGFFISEDRGEKFLLEKRFILR